MVQVEMVSMLLQERIARFPRFDVDMVYNCQPYPARRLLGHAAAGGHVEVVKLLLQEKAVKIDAQDNRVGAILTVNVMLLATRIDLCVSDCA